MGKVVSIGNQDFECIREQGNFYVDKTHFIKEWWESQDAVTLLTRPRRFGKTLNMDMLNCFFSNKYAGRGDLFEGLSIWEEEKYRELQGTYPVIFLSFAAVKADTYKDTVNQIIIAIKQTYERYWKLMDKDMLTEGEKSIFRELDFYTQNVSVDKTISMDIVCNSINNLACCLERCYGKKVIILLDEYDTPMQEAYIHGYWNDFTAFIRSLFNATFKTNPYLHRAVMTGITRVSKESIFSDLNNLTVITTTSEAYRTCFGFTEQEVFDALDLFEMPQEKEKVKKWYDGFVFGSVPDIYNPWSITNFLKEKRYKTYWASTSSNGLVGKLIRTASAQLKQQMEQLLNGQEIVVNFDEQIVFNQLDRNENAIWSLLMAGGYLKAVEIEYRGEEMEPWYHLMITNLETKAMFYGMFSDWFAVTKPSYNEFVKALLAGSLKEMNIYMNDVALDTFSSFDTGNRPSARTQPERFYHGFVLGLLVELREDYVLKSNRESGYGRYDVMLVPKEKGRNAIVMEFKVHEADEEETLQDTVQAALQQMEEKNYDAELTALGIPKEHIRHYGFAFEGKKVLIGDANV